MSELTVKSQPRVKGGLLKAPAVVAVVVNPGVAAWAAKPMNPAAAAAENRNRTSSRASWGPAAHPGS